MNKAAQRIDWVDYAKGICIVLVVMMHSTLGVEKAVGALSNLHGFINWAQPFRMPDFFLIAGLFLTSRMDRPWRSYLDSKVLHFGYFYILWMTVQFMLRSPSIYLESGLVGTLTEYLKGFVEPYGTLWFIYMLAIFFVVTKVLHRIPALLVFAIAAALEAATKTGTIATGHIVIDEFAARYVYFFTGFWLAQHVFDFAQSIGRFSAMKIFGGLLIWGTANHAMVQIGYAALPGMSLVMGFIGAGAVIASGVLLSKFRLSNALRYCGENSIVIYLSFTLFMAAARVMLLKFAPWLDLSAIALLATAAGVIGPVLLFWATPNTNFSFLFKRPVWITLKPTLAKPDMRWHSAAHVAKTAHIFQPKTR